MTGAGASVELSWLLLFTGALKAAAAFANPLRQGEAFLTTRKMNRTAVKLCESLSANWLSKLAVRVFNFLQTVKHVL